MAEFPEFNKEDSIIAVLGYIPFLLINIILPIYVLLSKKSGYARFHAMQSLALTAAFIVLGVFAFLFSVLLQATFWWSLSAEAQLDMATILLLQGVAVFFWLPLIILFFVALAIYVYMAVVAATGRKTRLPFITNFVLKRV